MKLSHVSMVYQFYLAVSLFGTSWHSVLLCSTIRWSVLNKVQVFYFPVEIFQPGSQFCIFVVKMMMKTILTTSSTILWYISCTNQICGIIRRWAIRTCWWGREACRCCTRDPILRGTVWCTAEMDKLIGKLDFKTHQNGLGSFGVMWSCVHADYDSRLLSAHGDSDQPKQTSGGSMCTHILYTDIHSQAHLRI